MDNGIKSYASENYTIEKITTMSAFVTPEMFGAIGDGITDDSNAIEQASKFGQVSFLNKTYLIAKPIVINSDIKWIGNNTTIKIADDITVDATDRYAVIMIYGSSHIENFTINYESSFVIEDSEVDSALTGELHHMVLIKVFSGKSHFLKNVNVNITEKEDLTYGAEVCGIWYNLSLTELHNVHVTDCNINILTTGHDTSTGCLWITGRCDTVIVEKSIFTRNHRGDVITFWANDYLIDNILVDNCIFNITDDCYKKGNESGSCCIQMGASSIYPTLFNNIKIQNSIFNVGDGFGASCIGCATQNVTIDIDNCKFIKNSNYVANDSTDNVEFFKRLVLVETKDNNIVNMNNCNAYCNEMIYLYSTSSSTNNEFNINNSQIHAHSNIYTACNTNFNNTQITTDLIVSYIALKFSRQITVQMNNCLLNCNIENKKANFTFSNSICTGIIKNEPSIIDTKLKIINSTLQTLKLITTTDLLFNSIDFMNNLIEVLQINFDGTDINESEIHKIATISRFINNCDTTNNIMYTSNVSEFNKLINLPINEDGTVNNGTAGQFAVSDGNGGITWISLTNASEVGA